MFSPDPKITLSESMQGLLDEALVKTTKEIYAKGRGSGMGEVAINRIGAAYIGIECDRALAYRYHRIPTEDRDSVVGPGELQRHAEAGFWTEAKTAEWLKMAGFEVLTINAETGAQYGYKAAQDKNGKYRIAGEIDGVILSGPQELPYPLLWESKKATAKKFKMFENGGVKKSDIKYYGQLQNNMTYLEVHHTLFSMLNLDTMKYYFEVVDFDPAFAQKIQDRAAKVLESASPEELPRITAVQSDFRCKFCDYQNRCWNGEEKIETELPAWQQNRPTAQSIKDKFPF